MNVLVKILASSRFLKSDLDFHLVRASMVLIFVLFGYQKWFDYEAQTLIPFISNGPLTFWMYPVFGIQGASWFLGVSEWLTAALLFLGFWNKRDPWVFSVRSHRLAPSSRRSRSFRSCRTDGPRLPAASRRCRATWHSS